MHRTDGDLWLGIDMGSTTVKCVLIDSVSKEICFSEYRRHEGNPLSTLTMLLREIAKHFFAWIEKLGYLVEKGVVPKTDKECENLLVSLVRSLKRSRDVVVPKE